MQCKELSSPTGDASFLALCLAPTKDPTATNMAECVEYVMDADMREGGLFAHQSEHASFQIVTPAATIRLTHGRLHQVAMRDPTDHFDLPDHRTWQMNMGTCVYACTVNSISDFSSMSTNSCELRTGVQGWPARHAKISTY